MAFMSSEKGSTAWKHQRLTAVILMLSLLFFTSAFFVHNQASYPEIIAWLRHPGIAALFITTLGALFYHSFLGIKMVVEDYVHLKQLRQVVLFISFIFHLFFAILGVILLILI